MVVFTAIGAGIIAAAAGYGLVITASAFVVGLVTTVVLGAALRALTPKMSIGGGSNRGYQTTAIGSALDHQIIYGKMRVGGARIYDEATGTNNQHLHRIIALVLQIRQQMHSLWLSLFTGRHSIPLAVLLICTSAWPLMLTLFLMVSLRLQPLLAVRRSMTLVHPLRCGQITQPCV